MTVEFGFIVTVSQRWGIIYFKAIIVILWLLRTYYLITSIVFRLVAHYFNELRQHGCKPGNTNWQKKLIWAIQYIWQVLISINAYKKWRWVWIFCHNQSQESSHHNQQLRLWSLGTKHCHQIYKHELIFVGVHDQKCFYLKSPGSLAFS